MTFAEMIRANPNDPAHGHKATYDRHKCRCTTCRAANTAWMQNYRSLALIRAQGKTEQKAA